MGLFDLFRGGEHRFTDAVELRDALINSTTSGNQKEFARLCHDHRQLIIDHFATWQKVPPEVRADRNLTDRYVAALIGTATYFAEHLAYGGLLKGLQGDPKENALVQWEQKAAEATSLMEKARYDEARALLENSLIDTRQLSGPGADTWRYILLGLIGETWFHTGDAKKALEPTHQALRMCDAGNNRTGVLKYLEDLYEYHRYLGDASIAAGFADKLSVKASQENRTRESAIWRRQANLIGIGEPLNRVLAIFGKESFELDELPEFRNGKVQFIFHRNRISLGLASSHQQNGMEHGTAGQYEEAFSAFREASKIDPFDPHSPYQVGITLMHLHRCSEAVEAFDATEKLAPGWFQCRSDLWIAKQIAAEKIPYRVFEVLRGLEDGRLNPAEKVAIAEATLEKCPEIPALLLEHGNNLQKMGQGEKAILSYRRGLSLPPEMDVRTRLLVQLSSALAKGSERTSLLEEAVKLEGNLVASAQARLVLKWQQ